MIEVHTPRSATEDSRCQEFDRQVETLIAKGYPAIAGVSAAALRDGLRPLRGRLRCLAEPATDPLVGCMPFVIVLQPALVPLDRAVPLLTLRGKAGFTDLAADDLARFSPVDGIALPDGSAYLLVDVDTGRDTLNVTPDAALPMLTAGGRSPLTLAEGIAVVTHYPDVLRTHNCFSLLGSRCGDRRVPALWVSRGRPRLGWCWAGNPHTWLGSASCGRRVGAAALAPPALA